LDEFCRQRRGQPAAPWARRAGEDRHDVLWGMNGDHLRGIFTHGATISCAAIVFGLGGCWWRFVSTSVDSDGTPKRSFPAAGQIGENLESSRPRPSQCCERPFLRQSPGADRISRILHPYFRLQRNNQNQPHYLALFPSANSSAEIAQFLPLLVRSGVETNRPHARTQLFKNRPGPPQLAERTRN